MATIFTQNSIDTEINNNLMSGSEITAQTLRNVLHDMNASTFQNTTVSIYRFGAVGDGVTDDHAAFVAFNTWARTQTTPVTLLIPPGTYAGITTAAGGGSDFFVGVKDLTIIAYGATIPVLSGCKGFSVNPVAPFTTWAPIATQVNSNSTSVTLTTPALASQFPVGRWVAVTSLEMSGSGFPPNCYYVDYVQVTANDPVGGVVTFADPVVFTHKITYPITTVSTNSQDGGAFPGELGGPATLFLLVPEWDATLKIYGLTVSASLVSGATTSLVGRRMRFIDCIFIAPVTPSASLFSIFENCTFSDGGMSYSITVDKDISHLRFINCYIDVLTMLYASDHVVIDDCYIDNLQYLSKSLVVKNSSIGQWTLSAPNDGANLRTIVENCNIANVTPLANTNSILLSNLTFTTGTFSMPLSSSNILSVYGLAIPGSKCFFNSSSGFNLGTPFVVLSAYQDSVNVYFDTTLAAVPTFTGAGTSAPGIVQHTCPRLTAANNTGSDTAIMTGKQADELPIYSYAHKVYSSDLAQPAWPTGVTQALMQWGNLVSLKVNVIQADTGGNASLTMHPLGQNGTGVMLASGSMGTFDLTINLKTAGLRTITPTTVTGTATGDVISAPGVIWFVQYGLNPWLSANITANTPAQMPIVEIELITDQGITSLEYTVQ